MAHRSLSVQMLVSLVCWATLILILYASGIGWAYRSRSMTELRQDLALEAEQLETAIAGALWNYDTNQINKVLDGFMKNRAITGVLVISDGRTFSRSRTPGDLPEDLPEDRISEVGEGDGRTISSAAPSGICMWIWGMSPSGQQHGFWTGIS